jgi:predicted enzyme related to lactoylglutathione lyase
MTTKKKSAKKKANATGRSAAKKRPVRATKASKPKARPAMFQKIAFTLLSVTDPVRARGFYEKTLGLQRGLASPNGVWTEYDLPGGGCLALFCHHDPKLASPPGGASVAFEVADLEAVNKRLRKAGVKYQGDVIHGPNCRMSNILDSEGNALILHQLNGA